MAPHLLGELAALLVAHVAGRRADQLRDAVLLHIFRHVDADHGFFAAEYRLGYRLGQLGLAHARGPEEQEGADGPARILEACAASLHRPGHRADRLVLADHALVQFFLEIEEALPLLHGHSGRRDAGPGRHRRRHVRLGHPGGRLPAGALSAEPAHFLFLQLLQLGVLLPGQVHGAGADAFPHLLFQLPAQRLLVLLLLRGLKAAQPAPGRRLVHDVDRLVRQEAVADIALGEGHRGLQGTVGDDQAVMRLKGGAKAPQDLQGLLPGGLLHHDRLEAALQGRILLDVLAVLVHRGRADHLQLAAGKVGFHDIGGVQGALRPAGADDRMDLVNKEQHIPAGCRLAEDLADALLELAAVLGARDHARHVQGHDAAPRQDLRHVPCRDPLGKSLHDRRLADARLADQAGVVLRLSAEDLQDASDLVLTADDGVHAPLRGLLRQVPAELVEGAGGRLAVLPGPDVVHQVPGLLVRDPHDVHEHGVDSLQVRVHRVQQPCRHALHVPQNGEQEVLCPDLRGLIDPRLLGGVPQDVLRPGRVALLLRQDGPAALGDQLLHLFEEAFPGHTAPGQDHAGGPALLHHEPEQKMLGPHIAVSVARRLAPGVPQGARSAVCILFRHSLFSLLLMYLQSFSPADSYSS